MTYGVEICTIVFTIDRGINYWAGIIKQDLPINTPPCTPLNSSNTSCHKAATPISAHHDKPLHHSIMSMKTTLKMAPLSLGAISNTTTTLDDLLLPVVADGYKYPTPSPTDSAGRGGSYSPTEDTHMTSLHHTNIAGGELLLSPDSQPALSPDMIGCKRGYCGSSLDSHNSNSLERHHGNSLNSIKDDPLLLGDGNLDDMLMTNSNLATYDLSDVSVSDILNEVQASLDTTTYQPTTHCGPTSQQQPPITNNAISFADITNSSNLFGFTMMSSSTANSANRMLHDPLGVRQRYAGVSPSSVSKHRSPDKEAAIRNIVDSFHQAEQMVPANEVLPTYTM
ncbi:uncharacterized protein [Dysidea avara]|uniref:uncharacterized protein n=1 Tax=Dysidea avara TaxID=196820 RepID=UPI0033248A69